MKIAFSFDYSGSSDCIITFSLFTLLMRSLIPAPDKAVLVGTRIDTSLPDGGKLVRGIEGNIEFLGIDQVSHLFTYRQLDHRISGKIMYAGIDIPARAAFAEAERILRQNLIVIGILTALTLSAAWFGADLFVLRRVRDLMAATRKLAAGNLTARTGLP